MIIHRHILRHSLILKYVRGVCMDKLEHNIVISLLLYVWRLQTTVFLLLIKCITHDCELSSLPSAVPLKLEFTSSNCLWVLTIYPPMNLAPNLPASSKHCSTHNVHVRKGTCDVHIWEVTCRIGLSVSDLFLSTLCPQHFLASKTMTLFFSMAE